jgi:hypothetical protein
MHHWEEKSYMSIIYKNSDDSTTYHLPNLLRRLPISIHPQDKDIVQKSDRWMLARLGSRFSTQSEVDTYLSYRANEEYLHVEDYHKLKVASGWSRLYIMFTEYALEIDLQPEFLNDRRTADLHTAYSEHMYIANDVLGYPSELRNGDWLINSITLFMQQHGATVQEAVNESSALVVRREEEFIRLRDALAEDYPQARPYLAELGCALSGSIHFQLISPRYQWEPGAWDHSNSGLVRVSPDRVQVTPDTAQSPGSVP